MNTISRSPICPDCGGVLSAPQFQPAQTFAVAQRAGRPQLQSPWDAKHPSWNGSNIAYWSQRIVAYVKVVQVPGPPPTSGMTGLTTHRLYLDYENLFGANWEGKILELLRVYPSPTAFRNAMIALMDDQSTSGFHVVAGYWYADPIDPTVAAVAAVVLIQNSVAGSVGAAARPRASAVQAQAQQQQVPRAQPMGVSWDAPWPGNPSQTYASETAENIMQYVPRSSPYEVGSHVGWAWEVNEARLHHFVVQFLKSQWSSYTACLQEIGWSEDPETLLVPMFKLWWYGYSVQSRGTHIKRCQGGFAWNPLSLACEPGL